MRTALIFCCALVLTLVAVATAAQGKKGTSAKPLPVADFDYERTWDLESREDSEEDSRATYEEEEADSREDEEAEDASLDSADDRSDFSEDEVSAESSPYDDIDVADDFVMASGTKGHDHKGGQKVQQQQQQLPGSFRAQYHGGGTKGGCKGQKVCPPAPPAPPKPPKPPIVPPKPTKPDVKIPQHKDHKGTKGGWHGGVYDD